MIEPRRARSALELFLRFPSLRTLLILLALKRITPRPGELLPRRLVKVPELDTGGGYRPKHRPQDPAKDPAEPYGSESSSRAQDHGWNNCTMSSGADAIAYHTGGELKPWGGDLRHRQGDLEGGTDLYDLRDAWDAYGEELKIRSGGGWSGVKDAHDERRAIVIQGTGNVPGAGTYTGGHACVIGIETNGDGEWLWGDPLCTDWQWVAPGKIRSWAEAWQSSIAFAVSRKIEPAPEPEPEPPDTGGEPTIDYAAILELAVDYAITSAGDRLVGAWVDWFDAGPPGRLDRWDRASWSLCGAWARGAQPFPVADALEAIETAAIWSGADWRQTLWTGPES